MSQDFLVPPKRRYVCTFEKPMPTYTFRMPEVQFEAIGDDEAYRYVIQEILTKGGGFDAIQTLVLARAVGDNGSSVRIPLMRWRRGPGWEFVDGRAPSLYEAPPSRTPWYGDGKA